MYEIGAKVLESIPESVRAHTNVDFSTLPRILASCDGIVRDVSSGRLIVRALAQSAKAIDNFQNSTAGQMPDLRMASFVVDI